MASRHRDDPRRYRRRILVIAGIALGLTFVVGAPFFVSSVEGDLEERVPEELADAGFVGVSATFDGQDGTLSCERPLADPEAARQAAYGVWGVRSIELDRSCRVNSDADSETDVEVEANPEDVSSSTTAGSDGPDDTTDDSSPTTTAVGTEPAFVTLQDALSGSPQLSLFAVLAQESDLADRLADPTAEPTTLFAPTDEAFEALPADVLADLRADAGALRAVMLHHMTEGHLLSADFETGPIEMLDGATVELDADAPSIGGALISVVDVEATTGVVHIVDAFPGLTDLDDDDPLMASVSASSADGTIELTGTVATEAVRATLRNALEGTGLMVSDGLGVDPDNGLDAEAAEQLAVLFVALRDHLRDGMAGFDGETLFLSGTFASEQARAAAIAAADSVGIEAELVELPAATDDDADELEAELNAFVTANPILFEPNSATITVESLAVVDQLAELAQQLDGIAITVQGHTDSDGAPQQNQVLSEARAFAVLEALVERGLSADVLTYEGFGSTQPVVVDGVEDKPASRRVEFAVVATS